MKNKKGVGGHVDWIVSIGIFLVYLLGMFVLIKPGVIPVHDADTLLDIMEENIKEDFSISFSGEGDFGGFYWTLYKVPLFVEGVSANCIKIDFPYNVEEEKVNVYKIDSVTGIPNVAFKRSLSGNTLSIEGISGTETYMIYFSDNDVYKNQGNPLSGSVEANECVGSADGENFKYSLGISEKTKGVAGAILDILNRKEKEVYEQIKEIYGYPKSKEFSFIIIKRDGTEYRYEIIKPGVKTNVYTRQWSDFILNYNGIRDPVKVSIKVW